MMAGDQHRKKAAEFHARAQSAWRPLMRVQFETLARAHLQLAGQADLDERVKVINDLCRELKGGGANGKKRYYQPIASRSAMQAERNSSARRIALAVALGKVLFWFFSILAALFVAIGIVVSGNMGVAGFFAYAFMGSIAWLIGRACRYVLAGR
jgi:hypothetical protein